MPPVSAGRVCDSARCQISYRRHLEIGGPTCKACGCPLPQSGPHAKPTCGRLACEVLYLRQKDIPADQRCRVCHVVLTERRKISGTCDDRECQSVDAAYRLADKKRLSEERQNRIQAAGLESRDRQAHVHLVPDPEKFQVVVVPHIDLPLCSPDAERVERVRARFRSIVNWALTHESHESELPQRPGWNSEQITDSSIYRPDDIATEATETEAPFFGTGCRLCRGACCRTGADHAYLNIGQVRAFIAANPGLSEDEIVNSYFCHVPELSIENSCIFHGEKGCTLPRDMRSDMCNRWLCRGLKEIRAKLELGSVPSFYVVAAREQGSEDLAGEEFVSLDDGIVTKKHEEVN